MAEYFLPDVRVLRKEYCSYKIRILENQDFQNLYTSEWSNALCGDRRELDVLGVGAYEDERLIGLAACSADCDKCGRLGGCAARIPKAGSCVHIDGSSCLGDFTAWQSPVLLLCVVQYKIGKKRDPERVPSGMGGTDSEANCFC